MQLSQLTDEQLINQINVLGEEILATESSHPAFDRICTAYDLVRDELDDRGCW